MLTCRLKSTESWSPVISWLFLLLSSTACSSSILSSILSSVLSSILSNVLSNYWPVVGHPSWPSIRGPDPENQNSLLTCRLANDLSMACQCPVRTCRWPVRTCHGPVIWLWGPTTVLEICQGPLVAHHDLSAACRDMPLSFQDLLVTCHWPVKDMSVTCHWPVKTCQSPIRPVSGLS